MRAQASEPRTPPRQTGGHQRGTTPRKGSQSARNERATETSAAVLQRVDVVFYKEILDHLGFPHRCELARVRHEAVELDDAIAGAVLEFEHAQRVWDWTIAADGYEVQSLPAAA